MFISRFLNMNFANSYAKNEEMNDLCPFYAFFTCLVIVTNVNLFHGSWENLSLEIYIDGVDGVELNN